MESDGARLLGDGQLRVNGLTFSEDVAARKAQNPYLISGNGGYAVEPGTGNAAGSGILEGTAPDTPAAAVTQQQEAEIVSQRRSATAKRGQGPLAIASAMDADNKFAVMALMAASGQIDFNGKVNRWNTQPGQEYSADLSNLSPEQITELDKAGRLMVSAESKVDAQRAQAQAAKAAAREAQSIASSDQREIARANNVVAANTATAAGMAGSNGVPATTGEIRPDQGYIASISGITGSDLSLGDKLKMGWDTTKYYFRGSEGAQGTVQALGGAVEFGGAVLATSTGAGAIVGVPLAFHAGDSMGTGVSRIFRDAPQETVTYNAVEGLTGSPAAARVVDTAIPFAGGVAGLAVSLPRGGVTVVRVAAADDAFSHGFQYADRVRVRGVQDSVSHNFPYTFDDSILATNPIPKANDYNMYQMLGSMNGKTGVFEIGVTKNGVIDHRFFRPVK